MFKDFEVIRGQLLELADVINKFKSEAVQLRLLELVFDASSRDNSDDNFSPETDESSTQPKKPRRKKARTKLSTSDTAPTSDKLTSNEKKKVSNGSGAVATLSKIHIAGFFKKARTINDILTHCETDLARRIKANEISGKLVRMVRNGELKRVKNSNNQYEYTSS